MLNTQLLNSGLLGGGPVPYGAVAQDTFVFDGYSMHNLTTKRVRASNHDDLSKVDLSVFDYPRADGGGVLDKYYRARDIVLSISLSASTEDALNELIDEFKYRTSKTDGYLEITINDVVRRWKATCTNLVFNRQYFHTTFIQDLQITFKATEAHSYLITNDSVTYESITGDLNEEIIYEGTANTFPRIYFIFGNPIALLDYVGITVGGFTISIDVPILDNDILIFDSETKSVTVNGLEIQYFGPFPEFTKGGNPISFEFAAGSTVVCDITVINKRKYL